MGKGYAEYVKDKRMERTLEPMRQKVLVKDIARRRGYSSTQYFIKVFKSACGQTPHQYGKRYFAVADRRL